MGAFDEILYQGKRYQTKSFDIPWQDNYEVRGDELWHEEYDTEDQSDPNAKGFARLFGMCAPVNRRWVRHYRTGKVSMWEGPTLIFENGRLVGTEPFNEHTYGDD